MTSFPAENRERWLANMKAAGVQPPKADIDRIAEGVASRLADIQDLLERLDARSEVPDFQRDTAGEEQRNV